MSKKKKWLLNVGLGVIWVLLLILGIVGPALSNPQHQKGSNAPLGNLIIFGPSGQKFAEWERKEAIRFSLDQIDSSIKYLFIGAATILGFILKVLIEPHVVTKESAGVVVNPISGKTELLLIHSAIGCLISIACGFMGRLYFARLADIETFSIYDEVGLATLGQLTGFVVGTIIMLLAAISFLNTQRNKGA